MIGRDRQEVERFVNGSVLTLLSWPDEAEDLWLESERSWLLRIDVQFVVPGAVSVEGGWCGVI